MNANIKIFRFKRSETELPLFLSNIQAGFPSPADDYLEEVLSLDDICIANPASTFLGRITGNSLKDLCIYQGDIVVIDKSVKPQNKHLIVCAIDGEFNAKILRKAGRSVELISANSDFQPIKIQESTDFLGSDHICYSKRNVQE